jgi:hypothetical protein
VRLWLVALSLLSFAVAYANPMVFALSRPSFSQSASARSPLPALTIPGVAFPHLAIKAAPASKAQRSQTRVASAPTTPEDTSGRRGGIDHRYSSAAVPVATAPRRIPVVTDRYLPQAAPAATPGTGQDPFAKAPVVQDSVGTPPLSPAAPAATAPQAPGAAAADQPATTQPQSTPPATDPPAAGRYGEDEPAPLPTSPLRSAIAAADLQTTQAESAEPASADAGALGAAGADTTAVAGASEQTAAAPSSADATGEAAGSAATASAPTGDAVPDASTEPAAAETSDTAAAATAPAGDANGATESAPSTSTAPTADSTPAAPSSEPAASDATAASTTPAAAPSSSEPTSSESPAESQPAAAEASTTAQEWTETLDPGADHDVTVRVTDDAVEVTVDGVTTSRPRAEVSGVTIVGADGDDTFAVEGSAAAAGLPLSFDGGEGGSDRLLVDAAGLPLSATGGDRAVLTVGTTTIRYSGGGPVEVSRVGASATVDLSDGDDETSVGPAASDGCAGSCLTVSGGGFDRLTFSLPADSVTIDAGAGRDTVSLTGSIALAGAALQVMAERIAVRAGASITAAGAITLAAAEGGATLALVGTADAAVDIDGLLEGGRVDITASATSGGGGGESGLSASRPSG